jgi:hypothetical protein
MSARNANTGKLTRTLSELESALADWDALAKAPGNSGGTPGTKPEATPTASSHIPSEIIEKTKHLLEQLRVQIAELSD